MFFLVESPCSKAWFVGFFVLKSTRLSKKYTICAKSTFVDCFEFPWLLVCWYANYCVLLRHHCWVFSTDIYGIYIYICIYIYVAYMIYHYWVAIYLDIWHLLAYIGVYVHIPAYIIIWYLDIPSLPTNIWCKATEQFPEFQLHTPQRRVVRREVEAGHRWHNYHKSETVRSPFLGA